MRILVSGLGGAMGCEVAKLALAGYRGAELVGGVSPHGSDELFDVPCAADFDHAISDVDCVVDFSHHSATDALLTFVKAHHLPLVLATTGHTEEEKAAMRKDYVKDEKKKTCNLSEEGVRKAERWFGVENLSDIANSELLHHINAALRELRKILSSIAVFF